MPASRRTPATRRTRDRPKTTVVKLDDIIAEHIANRQGDEVVTVDEVYDAEGNLVAGGKVVDIGGEQFALNPTPNVFLALQLSAEENETAPLYYFLIDQIDEGDRNRFKTFLAKSANMDAKRLGAILAAITQVQAGNPTNTSSGSRRSSRRTAGKAISAAS